MADDPVELVRLRNHFYRDNYRRVVTALLLCLLIIMILGGIIFYIITHPTLPKYFATTSSGSLIPLTPLDRPNQANATIVQWANEAAVAAFTLDFVNYRKQLQDLSNYFTPGGWDQYLSELEKSNNLKAITENKLISHAVATGTPTILQQGPVNDRWTWQVQMPLLVSYESPNQITQQALTVTMIVTRVSPLDNPKGISIAAFIEEPRTGVQTANAS